MGSPHKEEKVIGENIDLDLLSLFSLKDMQKSWEELRDGQAFKVNNGGRERGKMSSLKLEEGEGYLDIYIYIYIFFYCLFRMAAYNLFYHGANYLCL
jgi:hypothetical protein